MFLVLLGSRDGRTTTQHECCATHQEKRKRSSQQSAVQVSICTGVSQYGRIHHWGRAVRADLDACRCDGGVGVTGENGCGSATQPVGQGDGTHDGLTGRDVELENDGIVLFDTDTHRLSLLSGVLCADRHLSASRGEAGSNHADRQFAVIDIVTLAVRVDIVFTKLLPLLSCERSDRATALVFIEVDPDGDTLAVRDLIELDELSVAVRVGPCDGTSELVLAQRLVRLVDERVLDEATALLDENVDVGRHLFGLLHEVIRVGVAGSRPRHEVAVSPHARTECEGFHLHACIRPERQEVILVSSEGATLSTLGRRQVARRVGPEGQVARNARLSHQGDVVRSVVVGVHADVDARQDGAVRRHEVHREVAAVLGERDVDGASAADLVGAAGVVRVEGGEPKRAIHVVVRTVDTGVGVGRTGRAVVEALLVLVGHEERTGRQAVHCGRRRAVVRVHELPRRTETSFDERFRRVAGTEQEASLDEIAGDLVVDVDVDLELGSTLVDQAVVEGVQVRLIGLDVVEDALRPACGRGVHPLGHRPGDRDVVDVFLRESVQTELNVILGDDERGLGVRERSARHRVDVAIQRIHADVDRVLALLEDEPAGSVVGSDHLADPHLLGCGTRHEAVLRRLLDDLFGGLLDDFLGDFLRSLLDDLLDGFLHRSGDLFDHQLLRRFLDDLVACHGRRHSQRCSDQRQGGESCCPRHRSTTRSERNTHDAPLFGENRTSGVDVRATLSSIKL